LIRRSKNKLSKLEPETKRRVQEERTNFNGERRIIVIQNVTCDEHLCRERSSYAAPTR